jgi:hypothetical protein
MTRKVYLRSKNNEYKYNPRYRRHTKKFLQTGGEVQEYTIEAPPNDPDVIAKANEAFGSDKVKTSTTVKQKVGGIKVNKFIDDLKKIKIKLRNGQENPQEKPLEIVSSPADGGTITVKSPYKIVNIDDYDKSDLLVGTVKYVDIIPNNNVTEKLDKFLNAQTRGVLQTKGTDRIFISDESIKTTENLDKYPELGEATYIGLKLPTKSSKITDVEDGTQKITGVGVDIIEELKRKGLEVKFDKDDGMIVESGGKIKIDKIVNINDYDKSDLPAGTVKYVDVFTSPTEALLNYFKAQQALNQGVLKVEEGNPKTAKFISDLSIKMKYITTTLNPGITPDEIKGGKTYVALKLESDVKIEEPGIRLAIQIDDSDPVQKKKLSEFLAKNPRYSAFDNSGYTCNILHIDSSIWMT